MRASRALAARVSTTNQMSEVTFEIELRIATTGSIWSVEISRDTTAKEVIDAFMEFHYLDPKLGIAWKLLRSGKVISNDSMISSLIDKHSDNTFELIAKVQGG